MNYERALGVIWLPDHHDLATVAEAAEVVLADREAPSADAYQATYLLTTMRPRRWGMSSAGAREHDIR